MRQALSKQALSKHAEFRDFIADLFAAASALQSVRKALARRCGLGGPDLGILLAVARLAPDGPVSIRQAAEHLHAAAPNIAAGVNRLVKAGFLEKIGNPVDNRAVQLSLGPAGKAMLQTLSPVLHQMNSAMFNALPRAVLKKHGGFCRGIIERTPATLAVLKASRL